mgnify:CR=1 FL=1
MTEKYNEDIGFFDLDVKLCHNKKNGQLSLALPKKKLNEEIMNSKKLPSKISIKISRWWKK